MLNAVNIPESPRRFAGWRSAALLGALLVMPAEFAHAEPPREERAARSKSSGSKASGSKASRSSAKASSSSSRSSSRSQPRASSSSRSSRSQPRARSQPRSSSRSQPRASARSQSSRRSSSTSKSESIRRQREDRNARSRPTVRSAPPTVESVRPVDRTEGRTDNSQPRGRLTRPRYRTPSERSANERSPAEYSNAGDLNDGIERRRGRNGGDRDRHYEIETGDPDGPSTAVAERRGERRETHDRRHRGHRGGYYGGHHHHRHQYGCGHYGYGYSPYESGYSYGYSSPYRGVRSWGPEIHIYGGGGGGSSQYRDVGQGGLDLDLRPATTEIYIDGTYVGVADQFDGFPTYLWLEEGTYEIAFYKEGYETIIRQYTIYPGVTIDVGDRMRPGEAISPVRPSGAYPSSASEPHPTSGEAPRLGTGDDSGRIAIAATPGDAAVYLDGHFVGTASEIAELSAGLIVESGDHVVDVVRPGYENQRIPVSLAVGEQIDLKLDLSRP